MFDLLALLYRNGRLTEAGLNAAVAKSYITEAQADQIIATGGEVGVLVPTTEGPAS